MIISRHRIVNTLAILLTLFFVSSVYAGNGKDTMHRFFDKLVSLESEFTQTVIDANANHVQDARGKFLLLRPNRFRWEYEVPYQQYIIADGDKIWIYDVDLEQVTVKALGETIGNTPALLLSTEEPIEKNFAVTEIDQHDELEWLELVPLESEPTFINFRLAFGDGQLKIMELTDSFDQITRLEFSHITRNGQINPEVFTFKPPAGVDVVGDSGH
ncbi:MAG: outer membrane lipoprotein chaperone LolA [Gammaproteobacteria bacterium]